VVARSLDPADHLGQGEYGVRQLGWREVEELVPQAAARRGCRLAFA
jgi:hypothetical protein